LIHFYKRFPKIQNVSPGHKLEIVIRPVTTFDTKVIVLHFSTKTD